MASQSPKLLETVLDRLAELGTLRTRKMFGGVYIYCDDRFIATIHDDTLYFKANAHTAHDFIARKLPIFSYSKEGELVTLQYYQAPKEVFSSREAMSLWAKKAILAASQDATKKATRRKKTSNSISNSIGHYQSKASERWI